MNNRKYIDPYSGKIKSNRHARFVKQRRKDIFAINEDTSITIGGILWSDTYQEFYLPDADKRKNQFGRNLPTRKAYPKRRWRIRYSYQLRKTCNRSFRKQKRDFVGKSNSYRRCTEYWWELD